MFLIGLLLIFVDRILMFAEGEAELMAAVVAGYKIEIFDVSRIKSGL